MSEHWQEARHIRKAAEPPTAMQYIERGAIERFIENGLNNPDNDKAFGYDGVCILAEVHYMQAADVVEVKHGEWVRLDAYKGMENFKCSVCRSECYVPTCMNEPMYSYCPNCGAKMDGGKDNG